MEFYYSINIDGDQIYLEGQEAQHVSKSKRQQVGNTISVTDGKGHVYDCQIEEINRQNVLLNILSVKQAARPNYHLTVAISPLKNMTRLEWFVEKAVELEVQTIVPIQCERTEKPNIRPDRLERIAVAASKQCQQPWLPDIKPMIKLEDWIEQDKSSERFIGYLADEQLPRLETAYNGSESIGLLIGPEGDFTAKEIQIAKKLGYKGISLGQARLRTETAGVACCQIIKSKYYLTHI